MGDVERQEGLRQRTRRAVKAEIGAAALRLFLTQGFEATTMDQIAAEVGMSRRSLFNYFGSKEDLVLAQHAEYGLILRDAVAGRPPDETVWQALRVGFRKLMQVLALSPDQLLRITRMLHSSPSLRARQLDKQQQWTELLSPTIAERLSPTPQANTTLRARALVGAALACCDAAIQAWADSHGTIDLEQAFDQAVAAVRTT